MFASLFFVIRILAAWTVVIFFAGLLWGGTFIVFGNDSGPGPVFAILAMVVGLVVFIGALSHIRRVGLIAGRLDSQTLSNRHRRQIEIPFDADEAFLLVDAAVRELPRVEQVESARDSLQVRAKLKRLDPYGNAAQPARYNVFAWFGTRRNQILATVTPGAGTCSVSLLCEPDAGAWSDMLKVDDGTNLENAEALVRALARRVGERRRQEVAASEQTVTEKELTVARLSLLQAQVEPHFLYNTLASAQILTRTDPVRADLMLGHLILYLRRSLPSADDAMSTLGEELERAEAYLEILKIRMGQRLEAHIDVPESLRAVPMPSMMLQTLVENAIKHGLESKPGGGTIWLRARMQDHQVAVTVADDGQGFGEQSSGTGIGLKNLRERLRLTYGGEASFAIISNFPQGVAATINLPVQPEAIGARRA